MSDSPLTYAHCQAVFETALERESGVALRFATRAEMLSFRSRLMQARRQDQRRNSRVYPDPEHHMHKRSAWDKLSVSQQLEEGAEKPWVLLVMPPQVPKMYDPQTGEEIEL